MIFAMIFVMKPPLYKSVEKRLQETQLLLCRRKSRRATFSGVMLSFPLAVSVMATLLVLRAAVEAESMRFDQRSIMRALILSQAKEVAKNLMQGIMLNPTEKTFWDAFSVLMANNIEYCLPFVSSIPPKPARCCDFPLGAWTGKYAFCILDELLPASVIQNTGGSPSNPLTSVVTSTELAYAERATNNNGDTTYINLFEVRTTVDVEWFHPAFLTSRVPCSTLRSSAILQWTKDCVLNT